MCDGAPGQNQLGSLCPERPESVKSRLFPKWAVVLLLALSLINLTRVFKVPTTPYRPIDFRPFYISQYLLLNGNDPYDFENNEKAWKEISRREGYRPMGKMLTLVYPPWAFPIFLIFAPISFSTAYIVWYFFLPLFVLVIIYCCLEFFFPSWTWLNFGEVLLLTFAFKGTIQSMTVGQPVYLCLAFGFGSLLFIKKKRDVAAGILLGLSAFKITLALPFIAYFVVEKRLRSVATACITGVALYFISAIIFGSPWRLMLRWLDELSGMQEITYNQYQPDYPVVYWLINKTEIGAFFEYLWPGIFEIMKPIYLGLLVLLAAWWFFRFRPRRFTKLFLFLLLSMVFLLTTHHFYYDCLILIPFYVFALDLSTFNRGILFLLSAAFWIPTNGILNRINPSPPLDILYFSLPLTLTTLLLFLLWRAESRDGSLVSKKDS